MNSSNLAQSCQSNTKRINALGEKEERKQPLAKQQGDLTPSTLKAETSGEKLLPCETLTGLELSVTAAI